MQIRMPARLLGVRAYGNEPAGPAPTFNGRRHPGVNVVSSRERTVPIVFRCVSVIRGDVRRIQIGLIGRRRNTFCYGRPAAEPPRNGVGVGVPNLQHSEIIQPPGCNGRCLPLVSWGVGYAVLIGISR
jgi:hypothetical protein